MFSPAKLDVIVEEKKEEIIVKWREAHAQMRVFSINRLTASNYKTRYPLISDKLETVLASLLISYYKLFDRILDKNGNEMKAEQQRCIQQEDEKRTFYQN